MTEENNKIMENTKVNISISSEFNSLITDLQDKFKISTGRKPAKEDILLNLCKIGLLNSVIEPDSIEEIVGNEMFNQVSLSISEPTKSNSLPDKTQREVKLTTEQTSEEQVIISHRTKHVFEEKNKLEAMYDTIVSREQRLETKTDELFKNRDGLYEMQKQVIVDMMKMQTKITENQLLKSAVADKEFKIGELKTELRELRAEIFRLNLKLEDRSKPEPPNEEKKDEISVWEKMIPYFPLIATVIFHWIKGKSPSAAEEFRKQADETMKKS